MNSLKPNKTKLLVISVKRHRENSRTLFFPHKYMFYGLHLVSDMFMQLSVTADQASD